MSQHAAKAVQGHRYRYGNTEVMAMQSGVVVEVREIDQLDVCPLGARHTVKASWLQPVPMRYFHGEVPA
jgi:hypothetical protein